MNKNLETYTNNTTGYRYAIINTVENVSSNSKPGDKFILYVSLGVNDNAWYVMNAEEFYMCYTLVEEDNQHGN